MYRIEKTCYGVKFIFRGFIQKYEVKQWLSVSKMLHQKMPSKFGILLDLQESNSLPADSLEEMQKGLSILKKKGMERLVIIFTDSITTREFKKTVRWKSVFDWQLYIDASKNPDSEEIGESWLKNGISKKL